MTRFFAYDNLSWPEIAGLRRDTPLVIPLGEGYPFEALAEALGSPETAGILPAIPYGWRASGLETQPGVLETCLVNLAGGLRDDGFSRVFVLTPQGMEWASHSGRDLLADMRLSLPLPPQPQAASLPPSSETGKVILIPIGHTEQHGLHLPMCVDTLCIEAVAQGTQAAAPERCYTMPVFPYGVSTHRASFAGTLNVGGRAFEDLWVSVVDVLAARGFDKVYLISGHGGNCSFLVNVVKYAGERHRHIFCATTWLYLNGPEGVAALEKHRRSKPGGMGHACELETSFILHLRPDLVQLDRAVDETDFISTPSYMMDWVEAGALVANPPWDDDSATGAYGAGSLATAEHGRIWLAAAIAEKAGHVEEIHEQLRRRMERRKAGYGLWGKR